MTLTSKILSYLVVLCIGCALGTYFNQKHTIEEKIVYKDRVKTEIKEVITEKPDGTKVTERHTTKDEKTKQVAERSESIPVKKDWGVGVSYEMFNPLNQGQVYTVELHRRIIGDFYVTAYGRTTGAIGAGVTFFF